MKVAAAMECGAVVINGSGNFRSPEMSFGGYKNSGMGREGVSCTLDEMTQVKTIVLKNVL
jgi:acyl-CoA reductase-like NAD-dependent aldehyde dehydrogenase